jgi:hypothetical protein
MSDTIKEFLEELRSQMQVCQLHPSLKRLEAAAGPVRLHTHTHTHKKKTCQSSRTCLSPETRHEVFLKLNKLLKCLPND